MRFVRIKGHYPEDNINHWVHGDRWDCLRLNRSEAVALASKLDDLFGKDGYRFDVMAERLVPRWRPLDEEVAN